MDYLIYPPEELIETEITLPLSKSISNRALVINALSPNAPALTDVAQCDDTHVMQQALAHPEADHIDIGAAGTAMRFLTALMAATPGRNVTIDGTERMRQRPIGPLVDALRSLGADIAYAGQEGFPPLTIHGTQLQGGKIAIDGSISSQYISALLMVAPTMQQGLSLTLTGNVTSRPYIDMTLGMMRAHGATVDATPSVINIAPGTYTHTDEPIEADWSAASYWFEIAAMSSGFITLHGLNAKSLQGDANVAKLMEVTGLSCEFQPDGSLELIPTPDPGARLIADLADTPDIAQTLVVTCCMLSLPFRLSGLHTLRIKETDRLQALADELIKLGYPITIENDSELIWEGQHYPIYEMPQIDTYNDHRMAMAFAPVALFLPGIRINNIEVVSKSYPTFWDDLRHAGFRLEEVS
jgi:3-phosphoshikimate 1-carboxyvinyltransferase